MGTVLGRPTQEGDAPKPAAGGWNATHVTAWVSILAGLTAAIWIWQHRTPARYGAGDSRLPVDVRRSVLLERMLGMSPGPHRFPSSYGGMPGFGGGFRLGFGGGGPLGGYPMMGLRLAPRSRYFANLAAHAGEYAVSVRQVMGDIQSQNLFSTMPASAPHTGMSQMALSLQLLAPNQDALARVTDFAAHLTAVDNTGKRLESVETQSLTRLRREPESMGTAGARPEAAGRPGEMRLITMTAPAPGATYLKSIEGQIDLRGAETPNSTRVSALYLKFRIENVPLPVMNHIFGAVGAAYLDSKHAPPAADITVPDADGIRTVAGEDADSLRKLFPPYVPEPDPLGVANQVLFQPNLANRFTLTLPAAFGRPAHRLRCGATLSTGSDGEIDTNLLLDAPDSSARPLHFTGRLWDQEPTVLILPADHFWDTKGHPIALRLHLYLEPPDGKPDSAAPTPFPAQDGERGAILVGQVRVGRFPLSQGRAHLLMKRLDGGDKFTPAEVEIALDEAGQWRFANLSPGRYEVRLTDAVPYRSLTTSASSWSDYLHRRYGITDPQWQNAVQEITVRAGGYTKLRPFTVIGSDETARRNAMTDNPG